MARCGHTGQCSCVVEGGSGIRVSGVGSPEQAYTVSVALSTDAGNALRFDGQGRLYGPGGGGGGSGCGVSVAGLPEDHVVIGRGGAGRLLAPDHTLRSYTRAIDMGLLATHVRCRPLADNTPAAFPALSTRNQTGQFAQAALWEGMPQDFMDYLVPQLGVSTYKRMPIFAGWYRSLQVDRQARTATFNSGDPYEETVHWNEANLGSRWGFFGFGEQMHIGGLTLSEVLNFVARRTVIMIEIAATTPLFLDEVLAMIRRHCAQQSVIVSSYNPDDLQPFIDENIATMIWLRDESDAAANPPSQVADRGIAWVNADRGLDNSTITSYTSAGLDVVMNTLTRHHHWDRVDALGCRGVLSDDPVYMLGADNPDIHRVETLHTSMRHHGVYPGQLTSKTDEEWYWPPWSRGDYLMGWAPHGLWVGPHALLPPMSGPDVQTYLNNPDNLPLSQRRMHGYGLVIPLTNDEEARPPNGVTDILTGWLNPIPVPTNYMIEFQVCFATDPGANGRNMGMFFGLPDDRSNVDHRAAGVTFWQLSWHFGSVMRLRRWEGDTIAEEQEVDTGETIDIGEWWRFRIIVDDVSATAQRVEQDGTIRAELTLNGEPHGPYTAIYKNESDPDGTYYEFTSVHRQLLIESPFSGDAPVGLNPDGSYPWELEATSEPMDEEAATRARVQARAHAS